MHAQGRRVELGRSGLVEMSPTGPAHGQVSLEVGWRIRTYLQEHDVGVAYGAETGFRLSEQPLVVRAPDVAFVAHERIPADADPDRFLPLAPDLVVEVVSPGDSAEEVLAKVEEYLEAGSRLVWVVYPRLREVMVRRPGGVTRWLGEEDTLEGEEVLPGFACRVGDLFPRRPAPRPGGGPLA